MLTSLPTLLLENVGKVYPTGATQLEVLRDVDLRIDEGEFVSLIGPSGSGKSTLLNLIAGLDRPTTGRLVVGGVEISSLSESQLAKWRSTYVGFIFQSYHLIPVLTAYENVELPLLLFPISPVRRRKQVLTSLELVGLSQRISHRPGKLSGGEQQRVGIARALATDPCLIVADEPTGDLDGQTSHEILELLSALHETVRKTIVMVTHDPVAAATAQRLLRMEDGKPFDVSSDILKSAFPGYTGSND